MIRTASTVAMLLLVAPLTAADTFTQKPTPAPSVERGAPAVAPAAPGVSWQQKFASAPQPFWIWGAEASKPYVLRKEFLRPQGDTGTARIRVTCDNRFTLYLNGQQVAASDEWQSPVEVDVTKQIVVGDNVLEAQVRNDGGVAGFVLQMVTVKADGQNWYIVSDKSWTVSEKRNDPKGTEPKTVAKYGDQPWGKVFDNAAVAGNARVPANTFQVLPGFKVEKVFTVPKNDLGSWVCLTADDRGRLIASDQGGLGLVRITPGKPGTDEETKVEKLPVKLTAAQGLLFAHGYLYVCCNGGPGSGLYRVKVEGDGFGPVEKLKAISGGGEHGPHALRLAPDGKSILVMCGNHTRVPDGFQHSRVPKNWQEDLLLPRQWDANGHARGILAPGGYVVKTDPDGKTWEIVSIGYRNAYDMALNADGELFAYDSDMEWDMGMPWYRPTRVSHVTSGSEFGWRSGTGVWPNHYLDSLPPMIEIGPGSPVGVDFGYGAKFPAKYQKALYICDWTFGTIYALHLTPSGSTYTATKEEFVSRTPLPLTDVVINPADGAMYFAIGGRGAQSELYRVTYAGKEPTAKVEYKDTVNAEQRELRKKLEALHAPAADPKAAAEFAASHLAHQDRFIRYAARVAIEQQPVDVWQLWMPGQTDTDAIHNGAVALARQGERSLKPRMLGRLGQLPFDSLNERQQLDMLRAYSLIFMRMGEPDKDTAAQITAKLDPFFPGPSDTLNRELVQLLVYLKSPTVLAKTVELLKQPSKPLTQAGIEEVLARNRGYGGTIAKMLANAPDLQKLHYAFVLRNVKNGWTLDQRKVYFAFLNESRGKSGGSSYQGFINNTERDLFDNASEADRLAIEAAGLRKPYKPKGALPKAVGPGKEWTTADLVALEPKLKGRNFRNGERMYAAARCVVCHRFAGDGGATGPDLSQVAGRFGLKDLAEALVEPSKVISDQYKASVVKTVVGKTITGRIVSEVNGKLTIVTDPEDPTKVAEVGKADVESVTPSAVSLMPDKLLNTLNENEVLDLLAYMLSRGDPSHAMFRK